jgi:hypothetical protein
MEASRAAGASKVLIAMYNPFMKPQTLGQWLLGSVSWVIIGLLVGVELSSANIRQALSPKLTEVLGYCWCTLLYALFWWQFWAGRRLYTPSLHRSPLLTLAALLWLGLLGIIQVFATLFLAFGLLLTFGEGEFSLNTH